MHYPLIHHQYRAVWSIAFRSKSLYHISILPFPCSDTSWELTSMESKCNVNKHHKSSEINSFETWHITKTTQIGLWSHCRCYVGQYIYAFAILTVFVLSHAISTQHPETFHPASPLFFKTFHPASTRYYTHWKLSYSSHSGYAVQLHTYSKISYSKISYSKQYISIQQRILAWTNSSRRSRRHVWFWVEFHPHHCLRGDSMVTWFQGIGTSPRNQADCGVSLMM